jgi:hypothetical protein
MRVPVPCEKGWHVVVRASCSADSTSARLSSHSAIAQTRERNCVIILNFDNSFPMSHSRILSLLKLSHFTAQNHVRIANHSIFLTESLYLRSSLREISARKTLGDCYVRKANRFTDQKHPKNRSFDGRGPNSQDVEGLP